MCDTTDNTGESSLDRGRRRELARDALDTGMEDPFWLHNLAQCSRFQEDAYGDLRETAEDLREDAALMEEAFEKIEEGELLPAEAAVFIAKNANFGDYDTHDHLYDGLPIGAEEDA